MVIVSNLVVRHCNSAKQTWQSEAQDEGLEKYGPELYHMKPLPFDIYMHSILVGPLVLVMSK